MKNKEFIEKLVKQLNSQIAEVESWNNIDEKTLSIKPNEKKWNALECIEHLNFYGEYYVPTLRKVLKEVSKDSVAEFESSMLGGYFAKRMHPVDGAKPMKTLKETNSLNRSVNIEVINKFVEQQKGLAKIIEDSVNVNLKKTKASISFAKFIKLNIGDTFSVLVNHNERHIQQAKRAMSLKQ